MEAPVAIGLALCLVLLLQVQRSVKVAHEPDQARLQQSAPHKCTTTQLAHRRPMPRILRSCSGQALEVLCFLAGGYM